MKLQRDNDLIPFQLFATQVPLILLGLVYMIYLGFSFTGRGGEGDVHGLVPANSDARVITFMPSAVEESLLYINLSGDNYSQVSHIVIHGDSLHDNGIQVVFRSPAGNSVIPVDLLKLIRPVSFSIFSRPPPLF